MITVRKRDEQGRVTWEYSGELVKRGPGFVRLEARFNRENMPFQGTSLRRGDRFVETFYTDRWYNIFEIHDRDDDSLKGWYCNIGHPAVWDAPDVLSYRDLLLDLWVTPAGQQSVIDRDEFDRAGLDDSTRARALASLAELQRLFKSKQPGS